MIDCHTRELLGWHLSRSGKAKTAEMALVREIFEALEKIKDEGGSWDKSLQTLIFEARRKNVHKVSTRGSADQRKTG